MPQHPDKPVVETTTEARAGTTGHDVRYVLLVFVVFAAMFWFLGKMWQ